MYVQRSVCYFPSYGASFFRHKALLAALFLDLYETFERQIAGLCSKFLKPHFVSRALAPPNTYFTEFKLTMSLGLTWLIKLVTHRPLSCNVFICNDQRETINSFVKNVIQSRLYQFNKFYLNVLYSHKQNTILFI